ncbi:MAG: ATP-binding protein [Terracidiphilus sp.]|jgi:serine/threonine-protein kinase RsbW
MDEVESLGLRIRELLNANGLSELCFPVELLARECLNNAVIHGNQYAADKSIVVRLWLGRRWIHLEVCDEGPGFEWREACRKKADTTRSSGRGLQFYALYAERVCFNRRGNQITLWISKKKRSGKDDSNGGIRC